MQFGTSSKAYTLMQFGTVDAILGMTVLVLQALAIQRRAPGSTAEQKTLGLQIARPPRPRSPTR